MRESHNVTCELIRSRFSGAVYHQVCWLDAEGNPHCADIHGCEDGSEAVAEILGPDAAEVWAENQDSL